MFHPQAASGAVYIYGLMWHNFIFYTIIRSNSNVVEFNAIEVQHLFPIRDRDLSAILLDDIEKSTVRLRCDYHLIDFWIPSIRDFRWKGSSTDSTVLIYVATYGFKFDPNASETNRFTLVGKQTAPIDYDGNSYMPNLTQSWHCIFTPTSATEPKLMTVNKDRDVFFSDLPQGMASQYSALHMDLEYFSNALVCLSKDLTTVGTWYPSGVSY